MLERIVVDHTFSKAEPPELVCKVVGVVRQEITHVEIQQPLGELHHILHTYISFFMYVFSRHKHILYYWCCKKISTSLAIVTIVNMIKD